MLGRVRPHHKKPLWSWAVMMFQPCEIRKLLARSPRSLMEEGFLSRSATQEASPYCFSHLLQFSSSASYHQSAPVAATPFFPYWFLFLQSCCLPTDLFLPFFNSFLLLPVSYIPHPRLLTYFRLHFVGSNSAPIIFPSLSSLQSLSLLLSSSPPLSDLTAFEPSRISDSTPPNQLTQPTVSNLYQLHCAQWWHHRQPHWSQMGNWESSAKALQPCRAGQVLRRTTPD